MASPNGADFWAAIEAGPDAAAQDPAPGSRTDEGPRSPWGAWFSLTNEPATPSAQPRPGPGAPPEPRQPADLWLEAERLADTIRPRLAEAWVDMLTREVGGDRDLARKVFQVLSGTHMLSDLWRDQRVEEIHIHGERVIVSGTRGVWETHGFPSAAAARRAIATIEAKRETLGAVITRIGGSVVVSRARPNGPDAAALVESGVVTQDLVEEVRRALEEVKTVTASGPAARVVMRAFAPLVPSGSRVFQGPLGVLPPGCTAGISPLDADFVVGVRPGKMAEEMAAAGHVGALIANPETEFEAAVELVVSGRSTAPDKIATR